MAVANALAYNITATITAVKSFIVLVPGVYQIKTFFFVADAVGKNKLVRLYLARFFMVICYLLVSLPTYLYFKTCLTCKY
jgi:hypothetical protein